MISTKMLLEAEPKPSLQAMASVNPYKSTKNQKTKTSPFRGKMVTYSIILNS